MESGNTVAYRAREAVEAWKLADAAAKIAEKRLKVAWDIYEHDGNLPPSADLMAEVSRLRSIANDKLIRAIELTRGESSK